MPRVFFITGISTGFGNHLVQEVLDKGDIAVATARKPENLKFNQGKFYQRFSPQTH
jgi:NADP-dependent 3-hydroxy acid dehydrogenase YdfG